MQCGSQKLRLAYNTQKDSTQCILPHWRKLQRLNDKKWSYENPDVEQDIENRRGDEVGISINATLFLIERIKMKAAFMGVHLKIAVKVLAINQLMTKAAVALRIFLKSLRDPKSLGMKRGWRA